MSARPFPVPGRPGAPDRPATRRRRRLGAAALGVVAALTLAACGSRPSEQATTSTEPIVIGISLPLTGDFSQPGGEAKRGYEVWQKQVNATGGLLGRQVQLKIVDDASSQDTVVSDYTKLITQDKVDLVLGTFSSLLNYPASAVAEKNQMVFVEPAGGAPNMFARGFKYLFFAQQATAPHQADVFVNYIKSLPPDQRPKTAAYPTQDDPFAAPVIESMQKQLSALGVQDRLQPDVPGGHDELPVDRQPAGREEARPHRPGRGVRGRRRPGPLAQAARTTRRRCCSRPRRRATPASTAARSVRPTPRASSTRSAGTRTRRRRRTRSSSPATRPRTRAPTRPRTRPTPSPRRRCCRRR